MDNKIENKKLTIEDLKNIQGTTYDHISFENEVNGVFVKQLRHKLRLSQFSLACALGVTKKTVEKWEQGKNPVKGAAARLLYIMNKEQYIVDKYLVIESSLHTQLEKQEIAQYIRSNEVMLISDSVHEKFMFVAESTEGETVKGIYGERNAKYIAENNCYEQFVKKERKNDQTSI